MEAYSKSLLDAEGSLPLWDQATRKEEQLLTTFLDEPVADWYVICYDGNLACYGSWNGRKKRLSLLDEA